MDRPQKAWYVRGARLESGLQEVAGYLGDEHPDGEIVDEVPDDREALWRAEASELGMLRVTVNPNAVPGSPPAWFVSVPEPRAEPIAANLVAYASDHLPAGTIIDGYRFATMGVANDEQIGAIRWYPGGGLVHQIFVAEAWRRRQVGTLLIYTASAFHQANRWLGRLHADGRRTDLGERLVASLQHPDRIQPLSERMPPMDPRS